jgi:hypothetical protein
MNPLIAKAVVIAGTVVMIAIRAPHGRRSRSVKGVKSHKTPWLITLEIRERHQTKRLVPGVW